MKKSRKKLKGMTLIEMIISIAIFAMMGSLLVLVGMHIDSANKASNSLRNKIVEESPYAANHVMKFPDSAGGPEKDISTANITITIEQDDITGVFENEEYIDPNDHSKGTHKVQYNLDTKVDMTAKKYQTRDVLLEGKTPTQKNEILNGANSNLDLEFFEIDPLP